MNAPNLSRREHLFTFGAALMAGFLASPSYAETTQCTAITSLPTVISSQGVYCLKRNFFPRITSGHAIEINANNVTIDLNGFRLKGRNGASTEANGIYADQRQNITIKNGIVQGFKNAIYLRDGIPHTTSKNHRIEGVLVQHSSVSGIQVFGYGSIVRGNRVINLGRNGTCGAYGISVAGPSTRVVDNDVSDARSGQCQATGILMKYADGGVIRDNRVDGVSSGNATGSWGIAVDNSDRVVVRGNDIADPGEQGLSYSFATGGIYMDNLVTGATVQAFSGTATDAGGNGSSP